MPRGGGGGYSPQLTVRACAALRDYGVFGPVLPGKRYTFCLTSLE